MFLAQNLRATVSTSDREHLQWMHLAWPSRLFDTGTERELDRWRSGAASLKHIHVEQGTAELPAELSEVG